MSRSFQPPEITDTEIIYKLGDKDWEPPPPITGFKRDPGNAWRFIRIWRPCRYRLEVMFRKVCGAVGLKAYCQCQQCPLYQKSLKAIDCQKCEKAAP